MKADPHPWPSQGLTSEIVGAPWAVFMLTAARGGQLTWLSLLEVSKLLSLVQLLILKILEDSVSKAPNFSDRHRWFMVPWQRTYRRTVGRTVGCKESRGPGSTPTAKDDHVHQLDNANATLTVFKTRRNFYTTTCCCCCWCCRCVPLPKINHSGPE